MRPEVSHSIILSLYHSFISCSVPYEPNVLFVKTEHLI